MHIETPGERSSELVAALVDVWERSVRATHDFLAEDDIVGLRPEAESGIAGVERLTVAYDGGAPCGFAGSQDGKLEMLFVAPEARGRGVGRALLAHAVEHARVRTLDVNEQNPRPSGSTSTKGSSWRAARPSTTPAVRSRCCTCAWSEPAKRRRAIATASAIALGALAVAVLLTSLACYLLYYRLEPRRAYVAGAVPLAAVGLFAAAMAVVAALIR